MMIALFAASCRSSRTAVSVSSQSALATADTSSAAAVAEASALVEVGSTADTLELALTRERMDSLPEGASWVAARGAATLTVTKTPQGLAVTSRSPRPDIRAEVRGSSTAAGASSSETDSRREQSATVNPRESQSGSCGIRDWVELAVLLMLMLGEALIWHRVSEK